MIKTIIANWKCNMQLHNIDAYFKQINNYDFKNIDIGIATPSIFLNKAKNLNTNSQVNLYSQDFEFFKYGSFTGRISYEHLLDINIKHTIIGHSEQRCFNDNTDDIINQKVITALNNGFYVVLCIGEPLEIYRNNQALSYLTNQLKIALLNIDQHYLDRLTIAYEPIWSIGTGLLLKPEELTKIINKIHDYMKNLFCDNINQIKYLYGGSINLDNIESFCSIPILDGFLIGSASLNEKVFLKMIDKVKEWEK